MTNLVLIVVDTLRAKNLECYGYEKETAPFLSKMSEKGCMIDNYYSTSPWTVPAHGSIFSGKLPSEHGATSQDTFFSDQNRLVKEMNDRGYRTIGISENGIVSQNTGFETEFDEFYCFPNKPGEVWNQTWMTSFDSFKDRYRYFFKNSLTKQDFVSLESFFSRISDKIGVEYKPRLAEDYNPTYSGFTREFALDKVSEDQDFFLFLNFMPVHTPYTFNQEQKTEFLSEFEKDDIERVTSYKKFHESDELSSEEWEIRKRSYNASIAYMDKLISELYDKMSEDTQFIVIGDHGELFGEREFKGEKLIGHHYGTFRELIEAPFIAFPDKIDLEGDLFDHTDLTGIITSYLDSKSYQERSYSIAEYFGKSSLGKQFDHDFVDDYNKKYQPLFERKSASITGKNWKFEKATDKETLENGKGEKQGIEENQEKVNELRSRLRSKSKAEFINSVVDDIDF